MSGVQLTEMSYNCPLYSALNSLPVTPERSNLANKALEILSDIAFEELGDTTLTTHVLARQSINMTGMTNFPENDANSIANGANRCAEAQALGICAVTRCNGRKDIARRMEELGISRYKNESTEQVK